MWQGKKRFQKYPLTLVCFEAQNKTIWGCFAHLAWNLGIVELWVFLSPRYTKKGHSDHSQPSATQAWLPRGSYHHCQALRNGRWCSFDKHIDGQVFDGFSAFAIHSVTGFASEQKVDGESSRKHHQQTVGFSGLMPWFFWSHHLHPSCQQFLSSNSSMQPGFS